MRPYHRSRARAERGRDRGTARRRARGIRQPAHRYPRVLAAAFRAGEGARLQQPPALRGAPALHRRALLRRIRARIRGALQSLHRRRIRTKRGLADGELRFILSLRATGEGHISSIEFRTGVIRADHAITVDEPSRFVTAPAAESEPDVSQERSSSTSSWRWASRTTGPPRVMESLGDRLHAQRTGRGHAARGPRKAARCPAKCSAPWSACAGSRSRTTRSISIPSRRRLRAHHFSRLLQ